MVISTSDTVFYSLGIGDNNFCISRDESFIIFQSANGEFGNHDLFVSYRKKDATWTNPKNLGPPINTNDYDVEPYVTADNKYLFFMRANPSQLIYWVQIDNLIDSLKISSGITGVKNLPVEQNIQIYPNPTKDNINITFGSLQYKTAIVEITDISGKLISSNTYHNLSTAKIDLTGNPKGIYIFNLSVDGVILNKKISIE
jgi:hypothetical protein